MSVVFGVPLLSRYSWRGVMVTYSGLVTPYGDRDLVYIGSGNGLLPGGTKPLPEPMLTGHQWSPVTFISLRTISQEMPQPLINKICLKTKISFKFPRGQWVKVTAWIVLFREERFVEPWIRQTHNPDIASVTYQSHTCGKVNSGGFYATRHFNLETILPYQQGVMLNR